MGNLNDYIIIIICYVYLLCKCALKQLNHVKPMYLSYFILRRSRKHAGGLLGVQVCSSQTIFWFVMRLLFWLCGFDCMFHCLDCLMDILCYFCWHW